MKKNMIALLLSIVMTVGSISGTSSLAAETTAEEAVAIEETVEEATEISEEADTAESVEEIEEEPSQDATESVEEAETAEVTEYPEEEEFAEIADTSVATAEVEEPAVDAEEVETEDEVKEAALEDAGDVVASGTCGKNVAWTLTGTGDDLVLTISGTGAMYDYFTYYEINRAPWSEYINRIQALVVEEGVTSIGGSSFISMKSLTSISLPESLNSIGASAFSNCFNISNVVIPNNVTSIGIYAFYMCTSLTSVTLPDTITIVETNAFRGCSSLTSIIIPEGVTELKAGSFGRCTSLTSITIPESVSIIEDGAFNGSNSLANIYINDYDWWLSITAGDTYLSGDLYIKGKLLTEATIPEGMETIRKDAFRGCRSLTSVTIPDSVVNIDNGAFCRCSSLTSITIPDHVTRLGNAAFQGCNSLTSIVIPDSVKELGNSVFMDCDSLKSITIPDTVTSIGTYAFSWNDNLQSVTLPKDLTKINTGLFYQCKNLEDIAIPDSVTVLGVNAFSNCNKLSEIKIPGNVTTIDSCALGGTSISSLTIPDSVTSIGGRAFGDRYTITSVRYRGTEAQWDAAVGNNEVYYTSIVYNYFSVDADFELSGTSFTFTGKDIKPSVTVIYNGQQLIEGTDYELVYKNNTNAGKASVDINGIGNYSGTATKTFTIKKVPNTITAKSFTRTYSTKAQTFDLGVKIKNGTPTYASNSKSVTVSKAGKVTVKAKFIGKVTITITAPEKTNYSKQTKKITITVNPTKTALSSVTSPSAGKMTVKWKKNAVGTGYQIQYSTSSKFEKPKSVTIAKNSTLTKTIGSLAKGKKYYVRIRTYKTVGKTKFYSAWSAAKTVTIKK